MDTTSSEENLRIFLSIAYPSQAKSFLDFLLSNPDFLKKIFISDFKVIGEKEVSMADDLNDCAE